MEEYDRFKEDPPILQEVIPGTTNATSAIANDGEILAFFQEERLQTYPVDGGASSLRQGVYKPEMLEHARKIIRALEWTGPIYVEFIETDDGECYFIEINGRYWSSLGCAVASGVDFPWLHYLQFLGINRVHDRPYEIGVKQRRLFYTDIKWLGAELKNGEIGAVLPFITSFFDLDHDVFELDDPLPTAGAVLWAAQQIVESGAVGR